MPTFFNGVVREGKVVWADPKAIVKHMATLNDMCIVVSIDALRTADANAFYWAIVGGLAKSSGHSVEEVHEEFKLRFLAPEPDGTRSTQHLSVDEFADYTEQCLALMLEYGGRLKGGL